MNFNSFTIIFAAIAATAMAGGAGLFTEIKGKIGPNIEIVCKKKELYIKDTADFMHYYKDTAKGALVNAATAIISTAGQTQDVAVDVVNNVDHT